MTGAKLTAVGIVAHHDRPEARALAARVARWFQDHGVVVRVPPLDADAIGLSELAAVGDAPFTGSIS
jgi:hypothetical protein